MSFYFHEKQISNKCSSPKIISKSILLAVLLFTFNFTVLLLTSLYIFRPKFMKISFVRCSPSKVFLWKSIFKICSKFTEEQLCESVISIKLQVALPHECSPVNLLNIFRTSFHKNTSGGLLLFPEELPPEQIISNRFVSPWGIFYECRHNQNSEV